jgi:hypothetical protein
MSEQTSSAFKMADFASRGTFLTTGDITRNPLGIKLDSQHHHCKYVSPRHWYPLKLQRRRGDIRTDTSSLIRVSLNLHPLIDAIDQKKFNSGSGSPTTLIKKPSLAAWGRGVSNAGIMSRSRTVEGA